MKTANGGGKPAPEQYKITSLIFAAILLIVTLGVGVLFGYEYLIFQSPPQATESTYVAAEDGAGNPLDRDKIYPMPSRLIFNRAYASSSDIQSLTLRANVLPEDTDNQCCIDKKSPCESNVFGGLSSKTAWRFNGN